MLGITLAGAQGLGDKLQFASFPENYFRNTGEKVIDLDMAWIFDFNPYVVRGQPANQIMNLWTAEWPPVKGLLEEDYIARPVFASIAERTATIFGHVAYLKHPRLYRFEDLPRLEKRIVLHTTGKSVSPNRALGEDNYRRLSPEVITHIKNTYRGYEIIQIGSKDEVDAQVIDRRGLADIWELAQIIAQAGMYIGVDSGPYWVAACYPRVVRKKVMMQYPPEYLRKHFVPMHKLSHHSHWHDASCLYYNRTSDDAGITYSYLKI